MSFFGRFLLFVLLSVVSAVQAQDTDTDGDGISDEVELQYDFLDPEFYGDVFEDHDGDMVASYYELLSGFPPDQANVHNPVNILDYYPLVNRDLIYQNSNDEQFTVSFRVTDNPDRFERSLTGSRVSEEPDYYLVTSAGIFLDYTDYENYAILPDELTLGEVKGISGRYPPSFADFFRDLNFVRWFRLMEMGQLTWEGNTYDYIAINRPSTDSPSTAVSIYLKGVGLYQSSNGDQLVSYNDVNFNPVQEQIESKGGDAGGGSLSYLLICVFLVLLIFQWFLTRKE